MAATRPPDTLAFAAVIVFHVVTGLMFPIGMFPWVMILGATVFFAPDWPRKLVGLRAQRHPEAPVLSAAPARYALVLVGMHCLMQIVLPLRQQLNRSPSAWTARAFNFSWNVMVAEKGGAVHFEVVDPQSGHTTRVEPRRYLAPLQEEAMAQDPDIIRALGHHIAEELRQKHGRSFVVHAQAWSSLNGRAPQRMLDAAADLCITA